MNEFVADPWLYLELEDARWLHEQLGIIVKRIETEDVLGVCRIVFYKDACGLKFLTREMTASEFPIDVLGDKVLRDKALLVMRHDEVTFACDRVEVEQVEDNMN